MYMLQSSYVSPFALGFPRGFEPQNFPPSLKFTKEKKMNKLQISPRGNYVSENDFSFPLHNISPTQLLLICFLARSKMCCVLCIFPTIQICMYVFLLRNKCKFHERIIFVYLSIYLFLKSNATR